MRRARAEFSRLVGTVSDRSGRPEGLIWLGISAVLGGLGVISYTWARVAGLLFVPLQLPYVVSGGLTGLALVRIGSAVLAIGVERRDLQERSQLESELLGHVQRLSGWEPDAPDPGRDA